MATSLEESQAVARPSQSEISVTGSTAPTFIGDNTHVQCTINQFIAPVQNHQRIPRNREVQNHQRIPRNREAIPKTEFEIEGYEHPVFSHVEEKIAAIDEPIQSENNKKVQKHKRVSKKFQETNDVDCGPDDDSVATKDSSDNLVEKSAFSEIDKMIKNIPYQSYRVLELSVQKFCQTEDKLERKEWIKRVHNTLDRISDTECSLENSCGIFQAEKIFREFLMLGSDPEKVVECISTYVGILSVILRNGASLTLNTDSLKPFLDYLKNMVRPSQFCPCSRIRRDIKVAIKMLFRSVHNSKMLENSVEFIRMIQTLKDHEEVLRLCQNNLIQNSWFQHCLIINWLKIEVLRNADKALLNVLLRVVSYLARKWRKRRQSYRWKLTLTVVESLTKIAQYVSDLSEFAIAGDAAERVHGLIDFFKIIKDPKCKEIFYQHARLLVYIENFELRNMLLNGIFRELEVSSKDIIKERLKKSQFLPNMSISRTLHNGENTLIMSGYFMETHVVAKCYKLQREQLTDKDSFQATKNSRFGNESFMLSYLKRQPHSNIVELVSFDEELLCLVLKRVSQGCLLKYLRHRRTTSLAPKLTDQLRMVIQIADALVFLEMKNVIHLGIRAENVLLGENFHVSLTGFHSSCKSEDAQKRRIRIDDQHVKWIDPVGLSEETVSYASDLWSLGVLMYEIFTYGCVPYNNPLDSTDQGDFKRKPMTASQAKIFVLRGGKLPKHPCIPERLFQLMSKNCFNSRARASDLKNLLQEQSREIKEKMQNSPNLQQIPSPPKLRFFKEDVGPEDYNPGAVDIEDQDEDFPFVHLDVVEFAWNETFKNIDTDLRNEETYTNADTESNEPVLCSTRGYNQGDSRNNHVVVEYKEFRHIKHAEKLRTLNHPSLVKVLAINRFGPNKLEMVFQSFPLGNVLSALLSNLPYRFLLQLYMIQVASALSYLHDLGILHGCLKAENILLERKDQVKLCRLGFSKPAQDVNVIYVDPDELASQQYNFADTRWNPIEVIKNGPCSKESECWSFGIVCWEMSKASNSPLGTKKEDILPYNQFKDDEIFSEIDSGSPLSNPDPSSSTLYNIYRNFWKREPNERMSVSRGYKRLKIASIADNSLRKEAYKKSQEDDDQLQDECCMPLNHLDNNVNEFSQCLFRKKEMHEFGDIDGAEDLYEEMPWSGGSKEKECHESTEFYEDPDILNNEQVISCINNTCVPIHQLEEDVQRNDVEDNGGMDSESEKVNDEYENVSDISNQEQEQERNNDIEDNGGMNSESEKVNDEYENVSDISNEEQDKNYIEDNGGMNSESETINDEYENVSEISNEQEKNYIEDNGGMNTEGEKVNDEYENVSEISNEQQQNNYIEDNGGMNSESEKVNDEYENVSDISNEEQDKNYIEDNGGMNSESEKINDEYENVSEISNEQDRNYIEDNGGMNSESEKINDQYENVSKISNEQQERNDIDDNGGMENNNSESDEYIVIFKELF